MQEGGRMAPIRVAERSQGVKQGCPLSPTLFGLYIDDLEEEIMAAAAAGEALDLPVLGGQPLPLWRERRAGCRGRRRRRRGPALLRELPQAGGHLPGSPSSGSRLEGRRLRLQRG